MTAETEARDTLRRDAQAHYADASAAVGSLGRCVLRMREAIDILHVMRYAAELALAAEALEKAGKQMAADVRAALLAAIESTGTPTFRLADGHIVFTQSGRRRVHVVDESAIPAHLWTKPHPDRPAIYSALTEGHDVPGAVLGNAGEPVLVIKAGKPAKKEATI